MMNALSRTVVFSASLGFVLTLSALDIVGKGDFSVETSTDRSFVGETVAVPVDAAVVEYPRPVAELNKEITVFRNVQLSDVSVFHAKMAGTKSYDPNRQWRDAEAYHVSTDKDGVVSCQFQYRAGKGVFCALCKFRQSGADVVMNPWMVRWAYVQNEIDLGHDFTISGTDLDSCFGTDIFTDDFCFGYVCCELKDAGAPVVPSRIVFRSVDADESVEETVVTYKPILDGNLAFIMDGVTTNDILSVEAEMSSSRICGYWKAAPGYNRTYEDGGVTFQLQTINDGGYSTGLYNETLLLTQRGSCVYGRITVACWGYNQRTDPGPGYFFRHNGNSGSELTIASEPFTDGLAVRNLRFTVRRPRTHKTMVAKHADCLVKERVNMFPRMRYADVAMESALIGGGSVGSTWHDALGYLPTWIEREGVWAVYFQYMSSLECTRSVRVGFQDVQGDIYAKVRAVDYAYNTPPELPCELGDNEYKSAITNTVDGKADGVQGNNTLAICDIAAVRTARPVHEIALDGAFNPRGVPLALYDVDLKLAPTSTYALDVAVDGFGAITLAGPVDLSSASVGPYVTTAIAANGALVVDLSDGSVPVTAVGKGLVAGGTIRLTSSTSIREWIEYGVPYRLTSGANLSGDDVAVFDVKLDGSFLGGKRATLSVANGELYVTLTEIPGLILIFR